jgi:hypothetical protein
MVAIAALVDRLYRTLLWLYPAGFRAQHAGEMALDFADGSDDARLSSGWRGLLAHWYLALADLAVTIVQQWLRTFWPVVGALSMAVTMLGFVAALRFLPQEAFVLPVDPRQHELALLLLILLGVLIPIFGVVIFCACFLTPNLNGRRGPRRRV